TVVSAPVVRLRPLARAADAGQRQVRRSVLSGPQHDAVQTGNRRQRQLVIDLLELLVVLNAEVAGSDVILQLQPTQLRRPVDPRVLDVVRQSDVLGTRPVVASDQDERVLGIALGERLHDRRHLDVAAEGPALGARQRHAASDLTVADSHDLSSPFSVSRRNRAGRPGGRATARVPHESSAWYPGRLRTPAPEAAVDRGPGTPARWA